MAADHGIISLANYDAALAVVKRRSGNNSAIKGADLAARIEAIPEQKPEVNGTALPQKTQFGYNPPKGKVFGQFTVKAVPYKEEANAAGGTTIVIG